MKNKLTNEQIDFIINNYSEKGPTYCSKKLNINISTVSSFGKRNGLKVNKDVVLKNMSKSIIDVDDYKHVTKKEVAYILGLIWTDGHVSFANNRSKTPIVKHCCVCYDSQSSDRVFEKLNWRNFKSDNDQSIGKNKMSTSWVSSRELGDYLIKENFRNKKEGTLIYQKFNNLSSHFLRGLFDGDGCITISNSGKKYKQTAIYFSSTQDQDWKYLTNILDDIKVKYKTRINVDNLGKSSQLYINESQSILNLCEFMYRDSSNLRLERKYSKYLQFLDYKSKFKK